MDKHVISTTDAPQAIGPYSQAIKSRDLLFISGQLGIDPGTGSIKEGIEEQTKQVMNNLQAILQASGASLDNILKVTVYIADMDQFKTFNGIYGSFFGSDPPARATVEVSKLPLGGLVEIEAIARLD